MKINDLIKFLCCPYCRHYPLLLQSRKIICLHCQTNFAIIKDVPILMKIEKLNLQEKKQKILFQRHYSDLSKKSCLENWRLSMLKRVFQTSFSHKIKAYLDIGCGATGYTVIEAAKKYALLAFGVDISLQAVMQAKRMAKQQGLTHKTGFFVCSAENLPFKPNSFDYISAISVLEHLKNDFQTIGQIHSILRTNGYLYICVPNTYWKVWSFFWPIYYYFDRQFGHQRHYSEKSLSEKFEKNHLFKIKRIFYNGHLLKLWQLFLEKFNLIDNRSWWRLEHKDINQNPQALQLNAIMQKR